MNYKNTGYNSYIFLEKKGIIKPDITKLYRDLGKSGVIAIAGLKDYIEEIDSLDKQIESKNIKVKLEWFGATSSFQVESSTEYEKSKRNSKENLTETVNLGFYNIEALEELRDWEKRGLRSILEKRIEGKDREEKIDAIIDNFRFQLDRNSKYGDAEKTLINGGDIEGLDSEEFVAAVSNLEEAYEDYFDEEGTLGDTFSLQSMFQMSRMK